MQQIFEERPVNPFVQISDHALLDIEALSSLHGALQLTAPMATRQPGLRDLSVPAWHEVLRNQLNVPIALSAAFNDESLYQDPHDASKMYYLPRYRVAVDVDANAVEQYRIAFARGMGSTSSLSVYLAPYAAPSIQEAARVAQPMPHSVVVSLQFGLFIDGATRGQKTLKTDEVQVVPNGGGLIRAVFHLSGLAERDELYQALTNPIYGATLLAQRTFATAYDLHKPLPMPIHFFVHRATAENTLGNTTLFNYDLTSDPDAILLVTQRGHANGEDARHNRHPICVWHDPGRKQWGIFNHDMADMPLGAEFNIKVLKDGPNTDGSAQAYTIGPRYPASGQMVVLPLTDLNKPALVTNSWNPRGKGGTYNRHHEAMWFTGQNWSVFNQDMKPLPNQTSFNVQQLDLASTAFVHKATPEKISTRFNYITLIDHPTTNNKPRAHLTISQFWNPVGRKGVYNNHPIGVVYLAEQNRWGIMNLDRAPMPPNAAFVVQALEAPEGIYEQVSPLFAQVMATQECTVTPNRFTFPAALHPYIYRDITGTAGGNLQLRPRVVTFGTTDHKYYQDPTDPSLFYFLPDVFKLSRRASTPHTPGLLVRFGAPQSDASAINVNLTYFAQPQVNLQRLRHAANALRQDHAQVRLKPLDVDPKQLQFSLWRSDVGNEPRTDKAQLSLLSGEGRGIVDQLSMSLAAFQHIYDAWFTQVPLLSGQVIVTLSDAPGQAEIIPFIARLDDTTGPFLDMDATRSADGTVVLAVRNGTESPLDVRAFEVQLVSGSSVIAGHVASVDAAHPLHLAANGSPNHQANLIVTPAQALPPDVAPIAVMLDAVDVQVFPDRAKITEAIVDAQIGAEYERTITVQMAQDTFQVRPALLAFIVKFANGPDIQFQPSDAAAAPAATVLTKTTTIRQPLGDLLIRTADDGTFRYKRTLMLRGDKQVSDTDWLADEGDVLILTTAGLLG